MSASSSAFSGRAGKPRWGSRPIPMTSQTEKG